MELRLRPAVPADEPFLLAVYASTRTEELERVPWDDAQKMAFLQMQGAAQRQHYETYYPGARLQVILVGGEPAGRLWADWQAERIHILDLTILPQFRNNGHGTTILRRLMAEAASTGKAVTIYIEGFSPSVRLFERLGFAPVEEKGAHLLFRWSPTGSAPDNNGRQ